LSWSRIAQVQHAGHTDAEDRRGLGNGLATERDSRLRRDAHFPQAVEREQGETFGLGRYHEAVLAHGTIPVKYLPELVRGTLASAP
jgi:hypothetical protein